MLNNVKPTMINAVCFDFFNTLVCYKPSREELYVDMCRENGIHVELKAINKSLLATDMFWRDENRRLPIDKRTKEEQLAFFTEYVMRALKGAGIEISRELAQQMFLKMRHMSWEFKNYDDALPTLQLLKDRGLILGLISNVGQDMEKTFDNLGLQQYLDFYVTSHEVGYDKPHPEIFLAALQKAGVKPEETMYIGDQYDQDIIGARSVGMKAVLLDRNGWSSDITDCPRIQSLKDIVEHI